MQHGAWAGLILSSFIAMAWQDVESLWPRFRGPDGAGTSAVALPVEWRTANMLWKLPIPGQGNGSPVVWEDKLFLTSASADGTERLLHCVHSGTGQLEWTRRLPGRKAPHHRKNSLASSTPATDGQRVYVCSWDGQDLLLSAHDFQGQAAWQVSLGGFTANHGAGHSPIVHDGTVYLFKDHDAGSDLFAFDAATGQKRWQQKRPVFRACYSTPLIHEAEGRASELIVVSTADVAGYDPKTGNQQWFCRWSFDKEQLRTVASPFLCGDLVIVSSGTGGGERQAMAVRLGGSGDVTSTHRAWRLTRGVPYVPTMIAHGDWLFYVNDQGVAGCLEAKTGKSLWTQRLSGNFTASPVCAAGHIYAVNEEGDVFVFAAEPRWKLAAKNHLHEAVIASPAAVGGKLYLRGQDHLFCIGESR